MSYYKTIKIPNNDYLVDFIIYKCDITGEEIPENFGWYGNDNIQISDNGIEILLEEWIKRTSSGCGYPIIIDYLEKMFTEKIKPDRYISKELRSEILKKYKHKCNFCESTERLEIDHIKPISKKGLSEFKNLQVLCKTCNLKKGAK